jgi:hypothetical protein
VGTLDLVRSGAIKLARGVERFEGNQVVFSEGPAQAFDAVVLATGYRPELNQLLGDTPVQTQPGLFLCGFRMSTAGMLRSIAQESQVIARTIARRRPA